MAIMKITIDHLVDADVLEDVVVMLTDRSVVRRDVSHYTDTETGKKVVARQYADTLSGSVIAEVTIKYEEPK